MTERTKEILRDYPVVIEIPVAWGEMDAFQHVNNIVYFRYFESARIAYFEKIQYTDYMQETGLGPILASTQCKFKLPLSYPDRVSVGARVPHTQEDRFVMEYCIVSHKTEKIAAEGQGLVVSYDYRKSKKVPLPEIIEERILELERK
ncbi:acyl-CoA thioesterase [candidate division KSB1 bacterium]|nr:acyl-CoA thioesterase [candidate division KSB1 bacterium]